MHTMFFYYQKNKCRNFFNEFINLKEPINCFLAICNDAFGGVDSLSYVHNEKSAKYLMEFNLLTTTNKKESRSILNFTLRVECPLF